MTEESDQVPITIMGDSDETTTSIMPNPLNDPASRPASSARACVVLLIGPNIGRRYELTDGSSLVGRDETCDITLQESSVSRNHGEVLIQSEKSIVRDLGSTNGTYVNDRLVTSASLRDGDIIRFGRVIFKYLTGSNIENAYHQEIYRLTTTDPMTQVYNRRYFMETLAREFSRSRRYELPLSLVMIDLDHFKHVNDTYGHLAGDHVLKLVGKTLNHSLRHEDVLARYGGEEFSALLPQTDIDMGIQVSERLRASIAEQSFAFDGLPIPVTISVGASTLKEDDDPTGKSLIKRSDEFLLKAKSEGRNRVVHD